MDGWTTQDRPGPATPPAAAPDAPLAAREDSAIGASGIGASDTGTSVTGASERPADSAAPAPTDFSDLPGWVWRAFIAVWLVFLAALWIRFAGGAHSAFMIAITTAFALIYFTLPWATIGLRRPPDADTEGGAAAGPATAAAPGAAPKTIQTYTGPLTVRAAAAQVLVLPVALALGMIAILLASA